MYILLAVKFGFESRKRDRGVGHTLQLLPRPDKAVLEKRVIANTARQYPRECEYLDISGLILVI